jgi:cellulose synthase/poly-beta-1,6-N-acetylglucosamine synthase-like glycosyltransferase
MAQATPTDPTLRTPTVLAVLVTHDAAGWIRECLHALAAQTYPRLGVLAVDNASTDETRQILEASLGSGRVLALDENLGVAGAVQAALASVPAGRRRRLPPHHPRRHRDGPRLRHAAHRGGDRHPGP